MRQGLARHGLVRAARLALTAGVLWGATVGVAPAQSPPPAPSANFDLFQHICIDTHANRAAALAAGQAAGIALPAANGADVILSNLQIEDPEVHTRLAGAAVTMLIVGHKSTNLAGQAVTMNLCVIGLPTPDVDAEAALTAWIGTPMASDHNGNPFFVFSGGAGHHQSAATLSETDAAAQIQKGDMQSAAILHLQNSSVLVYAAFTS